MVKENRKRDREIITKEEVNKVWNEVLNNCPYYKNQRCTKPFFTGNRRPYDCPTPKGCCCVCNKKNCWLRCKRC